MAKPEFSDHFSKHADLYVKARPSYPESLFQFLSDVAPQHVAAWDCGTGNGQAARSLAKHFKKVYATDASEEQIRRAILHPGVEYAVAPAEASGLGDLSVDLITCAAAVHWFDLDRFYAEANRVLKPGGILAVWTYVLQHVDEKVDNVMSHLGLEILKPYWPKEIDRVWASYDTLNLPFTPVDTPHFVAEAEWTLEEFLAYARSWSAVQRYIEKNDSDPIELVRKDVTKAWGDHKQRTVSWDLVVKVTKKPD